MAAQVEEEEGPVDMDTDSVSEGSLDPVAPSPLIAGVPLEKKVLSRKEMRKLVDSDVLEMKPSHSPLGYVYFGYPSCEVVVQPDRHGRGDAVVCRGPDPSLCDHIFICKGKRYIRSRLSYYGVAHISDNQALSVFGSYPE